MVRSVGNQGFCSNKEVCFQESEKTIRAREKLKKRLEKLEKHVTQEELNEKILQIKDRISRTATDGERVHVPVKSLSVFDNNENSAQLSSRVDALFTRIKESNEKSALFVDTLDEAFESGLEGREIETF